MQARDVKEFLIESLRVPRFDTRVIREIAKARRDDVGTRLMVLEERRVKIVDSRMCVIPLSFNRPHFSSALRCFVSLLVASLVPSRPPDLLTFVPPYIAAHNATNESGTIASSQFTLLGWLPPFVPSDPTHHS